MVQAGSRERDHGGPGLVPGFFVAGGLMGGVHVGGFSRYFWFSLSLSFHHFYVIIHSFATDAI
jgi:hypothetical protein